MKSLIILLAPLFSTFLTPVLSAAVTTETVETLAYVDASAPSTVARDVLTSASKQAISQDRYDTLLQYYKYATSAYSNECPYINGLPLLGWINDTTTDTQSFMVLEPTRVVIAFRGTTSLKDFWTDAQFKLVPYGPPGSMVHSGFLTAWASVSARIVGAVQKVLVRYPRHEVVTTGHSLGGALASLAGITLRQSFPASTVTIFTYGQPRTGNAAYAAWVMNTIPENYVSRVVHTNDAVPRLPPTAAGYLHHGTEFWLHTDPSSAYNTDYCPSGLRVDQFENPNCSVSKPFLGGALDVWNQPHRTYFGIRSNTSFCTRNPTMKHRQIIV